MASLSGCLAAQAEEERVAEPRATGRGAQGGAQRARSQITKRKTIAADRTPHVAVVFGGTSGGAAAACTRARRDLGEVADLPDVDGGVPAL